MRVLVDTNVILDAIEGENEFYEDSYSTLVICATSKVQGYLAAHTITNLFYILRKRFANDDCRDILLNLFTIFNIEPIDSTKLETALNNREFKDFEDCLQMECAKLVDADLIITRDSKFISSSVVPCVTPRDFCKMFDEN